MSPESTESVDLGQVVRSIRLDQLTIAASAVLTAAGIPHALIKGPSTALWLYDPPRTYNDVDLLVPRSGIAQAVKALEAADVARRAGGRPGEAALHSQLMRSAAGAELDIHFGLPLVVLAGDEVWSALEPHLTTLLLDDRRIPALDEPARCLVLSLHALSSQASEQAREDLRRALSKASPGSWEAAGALSRRLGAQSLYQAGLTLAGAGDSALVGKDARLWLRGDTAALAVLRWWHLPIRERLRLAWVKVTPTGAFLLEHDRLARRSRLSLATSGARRLAQIIRHLPGAVWRARG